MGFNNSNRSFSKGNNNGSCQLAKRVLPRIQSAMKSSNPYSQLRDGLRDHEAGLDRIQRKKAVLVFQESEIRDTDIEEQLSFTEESDESDGMWLSSNCNSPSLPSSVDSQYVWEFDCWNISLHDQLSSMLSLPGNYGIFLDKNSGVSTFDESRFSTIGEGSLVLDGPVEGIDQRHLQEKVVIWLHNTDGNKVIDSSFGCSESGDSSYERSLCDDSSMFESSCTSLSTYDDTPSYLRDSDRTDLWVSLLDLEGEESDLVQDVGQGFDVFGSDFPSPCSTKQNLQIRSSDCSSIAYFHQTGEAKSLSEDSAADEPLFWPFDPNSYYHPEFDKNFLCMSPRKDVRNFEAQGLNESKSIRLRLHQKRNPPVGSKNMQGGCRRSTVFSSTPKSATAECKARGLDSNDLQKIATPSRLGRSTQALFEQHPCNISTNRRSHQLKARRPKHRGDQELSQCLLELEASDIQDLTLEAVSIEKLVGLNEFDGHEGINLGSDEDQFSLHGS